MRVAEHFYSIQGEGASAGIPAVFLRLAGCNLLCGGHGTIEDKKLHDGATWRCDTIEVWSKGLKKSVAEMMKLFTVTEAYAWKLHYGAHLVVTGGEPMQQQEELLAFLKALHDHMQTSPYVEIETNGTIEVNTTLATFYVNQWNVSPKLSNSGMPLERRINPTALRQLGSFHNSWCKVVVSREEDLNEVVQFEEYFSPRRIILMPAASDRETLRNLLPTIAEFCKEQQYRLSTRMQVEIWDKTTGV